MNYTAGVSILHLTDLHAGLGEVADVDLKAKVPGITGSSPLERLTTYLQARHAPPDYVVVSGDLCNKGNRDGLQRSRDWLIGAIQGGLLPPQSHIIITPGNHDVTWGLPTHSDRHRAFSEVVGMTFPHAHIPGIDPPLDPTRPPIAVGQKGLVGGLTIELEYGVAKITSSLPFLLDLDHELLIFSFNSALGCGSYLDPERAITERLDALIKLDPGKDISASLVEIQSAYRRSLLIDAPFVGKEQLQYFAALMQRIRKTLGKQYGRLTKVATLHHHITPLWGEQLEVKAFGAPLDAAAVRQQLIEFGFDMVLHGHKHTNQISIDSRRAPMSGGKSYSPLAIVSGGTVGGNPRLSDSQSFKLIQLEGGVGPRRSARVIEIPLLATGDPAEAMRNPQLVYHLPLADGPLRLHDLPRVKGSLDTILREKLAPELMKPGVIVQSGVAYTLPSADPDLVGDASKYTFDSVLELGKVRTFYDIIVATERLGFRQQARIYWVLRDVGALAAQGGFDAKITLLIGNCEATSLSEVGEPDEIKRSIKALQSKFAPAIASGRLEIRVLDISDDQLEGVSAEALTW